MAVKETERDNEYKRLMPLFHQLADTSARQRLRIRDFLVTEHLPVAEHIARKFRDLGQPEEDLQQVAKVGLINAVDRFDPKRGTDFLSFAVPTITGEVRRYFRDATWAVHVPRRLKELRADISSTSARLTQDLGRAPRPSEIAAALRVSVEDVYEGIQAGLAYHPDSLDGPTDHDPNQTDQQLALVEDRETLFPALAKLPEREATIVLMRFFGNMTQTQIAERVGISQMHVSRLLAASLKTLRATLVDR
jgi:RNA polymerase sigma-B factor